MYFIVLYLVLYSLIMYVFLVSHLMNKVSRITITYYYYYHCFLNLNDHENLLGTIEFILQALL